MFFKTKNRSILSDKAQATDFAAGLKLGGGTGQSQPFDPTVKTTKELIKQFTSIASDAEAQFRYCYENGQKMTAKACYRIMNAARTVIPMLSLSESAEAISQATRWLKELDTTSGMVTLGETIERIIDALSDQVPVTTKTAEDSELQREMETYAALLTERDASKRL